MFTHRDKCDRPETHRQERERTVHQTQVSTELHIDREGTVTFIRSTLRAAQDIHTHTHTRMPHCQILTHKRKQYTFIYRARSTQEDL